MGPKAEVRRTSIFLGERTVPLMSRLLARGIDSVILVAMHFLGGAVWGPLGVILPLAFCAIQDALWVGQSIGKRIIGLRVIDDSRGLPCSVARSFHRNVPFLVAVMMATIPWLWVFFFLLALPWLALETYLVVALDPGTRMGDVLANTVVVEYLDEGIQGFAE